MTLHLNKLDSALPNDAFCKFKIDPEDIFKVNVFSLCYYYHNHSLVTDLALQSKKLCAKFSWNYPRCSQDDFKCNVFLLCCYYPPTKQGYVLHLNKIWSTLHNHALYHVCLKLTKSSRCENFMTMTPPLTIAYKFWSEVVMWTWKSG